MRYLVWCRVGQWVCLNTGFNNLKTTPTYFNYNSPFIERNTLFLYPIFKRQKGKPFMAIKKLLSMVQL